MARKKVRNIISRFQGELKATLLNTILHRHFKPLQNYLIFSDPRGGSTWLMEIIHKIVRTPIIWEPLDFNYNPRIREIGFGARQYIPENESWPEAKNFIQEIFVGKGLGYYHLSLTDLSDLFSSDKFLIKFCRANALLPWMVNEFDFKYSPIYLVRHPMAVISSQLRHGSWKMVDKDFYLPSHRFSDIYDKHLKFLETLDSQEEILAFNWCASNQYLFNHAMNDVKWITIFYEELFVNPTEQINKVIDRWGIDYDLEQLPFRKPSITVKGESPVGKKDQLSQWRNNLDSSQKRKIKRVMDYFEVKVYSNGIMPSHDS